MYRISTNISKEKFKGMISGDKKYLPRDVSKALREDGKGSLLSKKSIHRDDAMKAVKFLMEKGLISGYKSATKLYQRAGREQYKEEEKEKKETKEKLKKKKLAEDEAKETRRQKNVRVAIAMDISDELTREEMNSELPGSPLTFKGGRIVIEHHDVSEKKDKKAEGKKGKKDLKDKPFDVSEVTDLDIG